MTSRCLAGHIRVGNFSPTEATLTGILISSVPLPRSARF
jgi:hypothetical protein